MPEFYLIPKRLARKSPRLRALAQRVEGGFFRSVFWLMRRLSVQRASQLCSQLFGLVGPHSDKAKKAYNNLAIAFPGKDEHWHRQTARAVFGYLGCAAAELIKLDQIWQERDQRLEFVIEPQALSHIRNKGATVFVTAHIGAWQLTNLIGPRENLSISTVYAAESNPALRDVMLELRQSFGVNLIPSEAGVRPLMKELAAGRSVGMAMDTRLDTGKLIPFFGRDALTNTTAARLALRSGAALIPIRAQRLTAGRFRITAYDPLSSNAPQDSTGDDHAVDLTQQINRFFEQWISEEPEQWICLKRRWPKGHKL
tara:strand:+ start:70332 stop:71267 length:936 start_codon:yes stop_codon:yes gene_type:complete